jgi:hypothetical protein
MAYRQPTPNCPPRRLGQMWSYSSIWIITTIGLRRRRWRAPSAQVSVGCRLLRQACRREGLIRFTRDSSGPRGCLMVTRGRTRCACWSPAACCLPALGETKIQRMTHAMTGSVTSMRADCPLMTFPTTVAVVCMGRGIARVRRVVAVALDTMELKTERRMPLTLCGGGRYRAHPFDTAPGSLSVETMRAGSVSAPHR